MNITILSAHSGNSGSSDFINEFVGKSASAGHTVICHNIDNLDIHSCTGCWSCWVKTPGKCIFRDDMDTLLPDVIQSDLLVYFAEPILGYVNYRLKMVMDRSIPLVHPYIELVQNECHHRKRYRKYPKFGVLVEDNQALEEEDLKNMEYLFLRFALNFKTDLSFFHTTEMPLQELIDEINHL